MIITQRIQTDYCYKQLWGITKKNSRSSAKQLSNCPMTGIDICYNSHSSIKTFQNRNKVIAILNQTNYIGQLAISPVLYIYDLNVPMTGLQTVHKQKQLSGPVEKEKECKMVF